MKYIFTSFLIMWTSLAMSQDSGDKVFDDSYVHEIRLSIDLANYWNVMISNYQSNPVESGNSVPYIMCDVSIDGEAVDSVGLRMKGFTSFFTNTDKKPFKIDINEYVPGQRYDGLRKLNLNNGTGDPAMMRDNICYDLLRSVGVKAPRTAHARVYINDEYWGLYQLIEQVDKEFLQDNFSNDDGNLFKNMSWSKFEYNGDTKDAYNGIFQLKTNRESDDWSGFINLMDVLNNSSDEDFPVAIGEIFNVELFLKTLAVDVAMLNWDSYAQHGRNWYIYEDLSTGLFHWIPWDYNLALSGSLGGFGGGGDECEVYPDFIGWTDGSNKVKFINSSFFIGGDPSFLWDFGNGDTSNEYEPEYTYAEGGPYQVCLTVTVDDECSDQMCVTINTEYDYNDCPSVVSGDFPHEVTENFIQTLAWAPFCCDVWGEECIDIYSFLSGNDGGGGLSIGEIDQSENEGVLIRRLLAVPEYKEQYYNIYCDIMANHLTDGKYTEYINEKKDLIEAHIAEDPNFLYEYDEFLNDTGAEGLSALIEERIDSLTVNLSELHECSILVSSVDFGNVVINEYVASNDSTSNETDEAGEHDDWIELYNNTDEEIDLSGVNLSDNIDNLSKWSFPQNTIITAGGYLIVWADKDDDQPGLHADFKLSKEADEIYLTNTDGSYIDSTSFTVEQEANVAMARIPNGTGSFVSQSPTFKLNNETSVAVTDLATFQVSVFPVPTSNYLNIEINSNSPATYSAEIKDLSGRAVSSPAQLSQKSMRLDVSTLATGMYVLVLTDSEGHRESLKFTKVR